MSKLIPTGVLCLLFIFCACNGASSQSADIAVDASEVVPLTAVIDTSGMTLAARFPPPTGYVRMQQSAESFATYLRDVPLFPSSHKVHYFDGEIKSSEGIYLAVINQPIGNRDLHHCADAVMHLRADYLWKTKQYASLHFNLTNGFNFDYQHWADGYRMSLKGNTSSWVKSASPSDTETDLWNYLQVVFTYAGTLSLSKELIPVPIDSMRIGDIFIVGGSPGHAVIVMDMVEDTVAHKKLFMLAQSYMPGQETQILLNPNDPAAGPWYPLDFGEVLQTPQYWFGTEDLKRFADY